jgi:hypothetical protein
VLVKHNANEFIPLEGELAEVYYMNSLIVWGGPSALCQPQATNITDTEEEAAALIEISDIGSIC